MKPACGLPPCLTSKARALAAEGSEEELASEASSQTPRQDEAGLAESGGFPELPKDLIKESILNQNKNPCMI